MFDPALYLGGLDDIRQAVYAQPDSVKTILCLGHNPGFSLTAGWLSGEHLLLKTANAAVLTLDTATWNGSFARGIWTLKAHVTPKSDAEM